MIQKSLNILQNASLVLFVVRSARPSTAVTYSNSLSECATVQSHIRHTCLLFVFLFTQMRFFNIPILKSVHMSVANWVCKLPRICLLFYFKHEQLNLFCAQYSISEFRCVYCCVPHYKITRTFVSHCNSSAHLFEIKCSFSLSLSHLYAQAEHFRAERGGFYGNTKRSPSGSCLQACAECQLDNQACCND